MRLSMDKNYIFSLTKMRMSMDKNYIFILHYNWRFLKYRQI